MNICPIHTEDDGRAALADTSALMQSDPTPGTPQGDRLDVLAHSGPHEPMKAHAIQVARRVARNATCPIRERKPLSYPRFSPRPPQYDIVLM